MIKFLFSSVLITLACLNAAAQSGHCASSNKMQELLAADPDLQQRRDDIEAFTEKWIREHADNLNERGGITIPVVVHVVYNTSEQNISDFQIQTQIAVLNEDYRKLNGDVGNVPSVWSNLVADVGIEFALATCNPNGFQTSGITRTQTSVDNWLTSDNIKSSAMGGHDPWDNDSYLNIWVGNIQSGFLGWAYQPGITPDWKDGVVIGYKYFGRPSQSSTYSLGRTATHEIGHYFNLDHLWGSGLSNSDCSADDFVADTPKQQDANQGCSTSFPHETCGSGANSDMFNNFMDYGNDPCMFFFTEGQKARMLAALNGPRASLLSSSGLSQCPVGIEETILRSSLNIYPNPAIDQINIQSDQLENLVSDIRILDLSGKVVLQRTNVSLGHAAFVLSVNELSNGTYVLEIRSKRELVTQKIHIIR